MTIKIRQTPYERSGDNPGPYPVYADEVRAQLGVIAMAGSDDLPESLGDEPDATEPEFSVVLYDPGPQDAGTPAGRVRQMLNDLVDDAATVKLFGVGPDFVWSDGSTIAASAGGAIGDWVFYDTHNCDGDGRWVRGTDGNEVCTTSAGILVHELGHVFLDHPTGTVDEDEREAVGVENDLRTAQGLVPRDPDHWPESDCGCPGGDCCVVASVATGSPYSVEVNTLRNIRDRALRNTAFGRHLFDVLYEEYYSVSVPICRIMVGDDDMRDEVADWLVRPLVQALQAAWLYAREPEKPEALARLIIGEGGDTPLSPSVPGGSWSLIECVLAGAEAGEVSEMPWLSLTPGLQRAYEILAERLPHCPHVRWGVVGPLRIYAEARLRYQTAQDAEQLGRWLAGAFDVWLGDMPIDYVAAQMPVDDLVADLRVLASTVFTRPEARRRLGRRLVQTGAVGCDPYVSCRLREGGYLQ